MPREHRSGRNDPCWCGSGRKYKKCHLGRSSQTAINPFQIERQILKNFGKKYCLHPERNTGECKGSIVKAHTVQQNGGLSRISRNNHVYAFKPSMVQLFENQGRLIPQLIGINNASTFTGFCAFHDNRTFAPIEKTQFQGNMQQCFLLGYRALCRELFMKRANLASVDLHREADRGRDLAVQAQLQEFVNLFHMALQNSLDRLERQKVSHDRILLKGSYENVNRVIIYTENTPDVLCSGGFSPHYDFNGTLLQDHKNLQALLDLLTCTIIPTEAGGAVIFTWLDETQGSNSRLLRSLFALPEEAIGNAIVSMLFEHLENIFWSPVWWGGINDSSKNYLVKKSTSGVSVDRDATCLDVSGVKLVDWKIKSIESNVLNS